MSNAVGSAFSTLAMRFVGEALGLQGRGVDAGRIGQRAVADGIGLDLGDIGSRDSRARGSASRHGAVDDLPVAATGELLELHQREVRLDAGGVAIHDQADGAGRRAPRWSGRCGSRAVSPSSSASSQAALRVADDVGSAGSEA